MKDLKLEKDWGPFEKGSIVKVDNLRAKQLSSKGADVRELGFKKSIKKKQDGERPGS